MNDLYFYTFKNGKKVIANEHFCEKYNITEPVVKKELITPSYQPHCVDITAFYYNELVDIPTKKVLNKFSKRSKNNGLDKYTKFDHSKREQGNWFNFPKDWWFNKNR